MGRATEFAIATLPALAALAVFGGPGLLTLLRHPAQRSVTHSPAPQTTPTVASVPTRPSTPAPPAAEPVVQAHPLVRRPPKPASTPRSVALDRARTLTRHLYAGQMAPLWKAFTPEVQAQWGSYPAFLAYRTGGQRAYGNEGQLLSEELHQDGPVQYYTRTARFERGTPRTWTLIIGLNAGGQVVQFGVVATDLLPAPPAARAP
ncbi:hypothetical protein [Deinococcus sonorensis]|uniref:DUF3887 domain-containing protein n=2 Tax=Deinococcus sonorensis TaxID=309891 RepID=A0AAU7UEX2_9DEIO